jgi:hypothetical protein
MGFCDYKNMFGEPNKDLHVYRIPVINLAFIDVLMTVIIGYSISKYFSYSFITVMLILIIIAILAHRVFCVRTTVDKFLFS